MDGAGPVGRALAIEWRHGGLKLGQYNRSAGRSRLALRRNVQGNQAPVAVAERTSGNPHNRWFRPGPSLLAIVTCTLLGAASTASSAPHAAHLDPIEAPGQE